MKPRVKQVEFKKGIKFGLIAGVVVAGLAIMIYFLSPQTMIPQASIIKVEESSTLKPWTSWGKYTIIPAVYQTVYISVPGLAGGFNFFKITDEDSAAGSLGLSKSAMYCSNGTAKLFWGYNVNNQWVAMFKKSGAWWIGGLYPMTEDQVVKANRILWTFALS